MGGQLMKALALAALLVTAAPVTMRAESAEVIRYNLLVAPPAAWPQACDDALSSYDDLEPVADDFHPVLEFHFHGLDAPDQPTVFIDAEILLPLPPADRAKVSVGTPELFMQQLYFNLRGHPFRSRGSMCQGRCGSSRPTGRLTSVPPRPPRQLRHIAPGRVTVAAAENVMAKYVISLPSAAMPALESTSAP
jgi:hypothetical protein